MEFLKNFGKFTFGGGHFFVAGTGNLNGTAGNTESITVNADLADMSANNSYNGIHCVLNDSVLHLMLDYKELSCDSYTAILKLIFEKEYGAEFSGIIIEPDKEYDFVNNDESDSVQSNSILSSVSFTVAADAVKINPELETELHCKCEPSFLKESFEKKYEWYKSIIINAYNMYGMSITKVYFNKLDDAEKNELWKNYFLQHIALENECGLDCNKIKAEDMFVQQKDGFCIKDRCAIADKLIECLIENSLRSCMPITAIASFYSDLFSVQNQIVDAKEPWNGNYKINYLLYIVMHITKFIRNGWCNVKKSENSSESIANYITNTKKYAVFMSRDKSDVTMIFTNSGSKSCGYRISFENCSFENRLFSKIETSGLNDAKISSKNCFNYVNVEKLEENEMFITVKPFSVVTLTTLNAALVNGVNTVEQTVYNPERLCLPYNDSFFYDDEFIQRRCAAAMLMMSENGSFKAETLADERFVCQTEENNDNNYDAKATVTAFIGDDSWANYQVEVKFMMIPHIPENFVGIGIRYNSSHCGVALKLYCSGDWEIIISDEIVASGKTYFLRMNEWNTLRIMALGNAYIVQLDGKEIANYIEKEAMQTYGRAVFLSAHYKNRFKDFVAEPVYGMRMYADLIDATDKGVKYSGIISIDTKASTRFSNSSCVKLQKESGFSVTYMGYGFALCGTSTDAVISIALDGDIIEDSICVANSSFRQSFYRNDSVEKGIHKVKVYVKSGKIELDSINVFTDSAERRKAVVITDDASGKKLNKANVTKAAAVAAAGVSAAIIMSKLRGKRKK